MPVSPLSWVGNVKWTSTLGLGCCSSRGWGSYNVEWDYVNQDDVPITAFRINDQLTGRKQAHPGPSSETSRPRTFTARPS